MENESFLPDGAETRSRLLAWTPYLREHYSAIASGETPASFKQDDKEPLWGIAYVLEDAIGFYVSSSVPSPFAAMLGFRGDPLPPIDLRIPFANIRAVRFERKREPKTKLGKFISSILIKSDSVISVEWGVGTEEGKCIRFFAAQSTVDFERTLSETRAR